MATSMSKAFIKMGDTGIAKLFDPVDASPKDTQNFTVPLNPLSDPEPFPETAIIRFIVTASDRYANFPGPADNVHPVGMVLTPQAGNTFTIRARNSDTAALGGGASFMWLAIAENATREEERFEPIPMNQIFVGQPASFSTSNSAGDRQTFPNFSDPANPVVQDTYRFWNTFGTKPFAAIADEPLIFATANNVGCGLPVVGQAHNAAAVPLIREFNLTPAGFNLSARNADIAGSCGFNWVALKQLLKGRELEAGQPQPPDLLVDTGQFPDDSLGDQFFFAPGGQDPNDWATAEVQFNPPPVQFSHTPLGPFPRRPPPPPFFSTEPVVLITPRVSPPNDAEPLSCAPVAIAQNVTRFGFTLAARNTDSNENVAPAVFDWVAFGT